LTKNGLGNILGNFLTNSSGHTGNHGLTAQQLIENCVKQLGTDIMIFKIFLPKKLRKKLAFFTRNKARLCKKFDHNLGF
jgi:hypothetical protein